MTYVGAIDQGTSSTRFMIFRDDGSVVATHQMEHTQHFPSPGLVEHEPMEIWKNTEACIDGALSSANLSISDLASIGITNQRETTVVWDRATGEPLNNAIVWNDTRTADIAKRFESEGENGADRFRPQCGLPLASYFSVTKLIWIMENVEGAREKLNSGEACFGTIDSWLVYNLTNKALHITDVTNASRTMLMNLKTLDWDPELLSAFGVPAACLPAIKSSSEVYGEYKGCKIAAILGDQQAALFGQTCFSEGDVKSTYGTGCFLMMNTAGNIRQSKHGLLTTVGYKLGEKGEVVYALEGAVAYCGSVVQWLRDNLGIISSAPETEALAAEVGSNGGMYFVPAFSGLFAPRWRSDARGTMVGMTAFNTKGHLCRAALEAAAFQAREVIEAMGKDLGGDGTFNAELQVDGGMTMNSICMQFQSDILGCPVRRPTIPETTALGAAYSAGLATGVWSSVEELKKMWGEDRRWEPNMGEEEKSKLWSEWHKAVEKSLGWVKE